MKTVIINIVLVIVVVAFTSCNDKKVEKSNQHEMKNEMNMTEHQSESGDLELIRKGVIDLASIDENKDDSLYECPMDWDVLSDNAGDCPSCGMQLKKISIAEVKSNLDKYGYEYKK